MPSPPDRQPSVLEIIPGDLPLPPLNLFCESAFKQGVFDIRWTLPSEIQTNTKFSIIGVNVYRSFDSEYGPYFRLNTTPVGATFYRDRVEVVVALQEDVSNSFHSRDFDPDGRFVFTTAHRPIVIAPSPGSANITNLNVQVTINGIPAFVDSINSAAGEVELRRYPTFDVTNQQTTPAVLPSKPTDVILATYRYIRNHVRTDLSQRIFYRVTSVAIDSSGNLIETPLDRAAQTNNFEIEKLDYIWREAIRRQSWLLDHGGERVKLFIRRAVGPLCGCNSDLYKQPLSDCLACYGTGILGGYDGPYDIIIAPDDAAKNISQSNRGRTMEHTYDTWTLPTPLVSQRDFIVKLNNDRYGIGPVRMPSNRAMQLQQFFPISHLDESDIRYKVPLPDPFFARYPETRYAVPGGDNSTPMITESNGIPDERQIRGSTVTYENILRR